MMDPNSFMRHYGIGQGGYVNLYPPPYAPPGRQVYPYPTVLSAGSHLPYNPWEVNYSFSSLAMSMPQKPAAVHFNPAERASAPSTFPLFSLLPPELRIRIWSLAATQNRVVEIRSWGSGQYAPVKYSVHPHYLPAIFHVCKESRTEARRIYKRISIGASASTRIKDRRYVDWKHHPANRNAKGRVVTVNGSLPLATPHPPVYTYFSPERDIIYLGPEFQGHHLLRFLVAVGEGKELQGLQSLALDYKFWIGNARGDALQHALWGLRQAGSLSQIIVVPDDEARCLEDRWYYGKHDITMSEPDMRGIGYPLKYWMRTFIGTLERWFERVWKDQKSSHGKSRLHKHGKSSKENGAPRLPKVIIMSIKRNGTIMRKYTDGLSDIQNSLGDMEVWKAWNPPTNS